MRKYFYFFIALIIPVNIIIGYYWSGIYWSMLFFGPLIIIGLMDVFQKKQTIKRNFPVIGQLRYILESIRPEIQQYFVESNLDGRPFSRNFRSIVYQRSKRALDTSPFGTQINVYDAGYEWIDHSIYAKKHKHQNFNPRIIIGGKDCKQPYSSSLLNISAMSFGSLSQNAVLALNAGAKNGDFAHNTGEGGVSPYHLSPGGDVIWQIGTGYFGCRDEAGNFSSEKFKETVAHPSIKMIELKISQGAKPGHGGILPASKNTPEIARIRGLIPYTDVNSPPAHAVFSSPEGLIQFIHQLRELSGGKPVGFKLCIGRKKEFIAICKAMKEMNIQPDFIAIDGGEGGTGAAPIEFTNSIGMPLREGLAFAVDVLRGFDLKKDIKVLASGKITTAFHMMRLLAIGADGCYSARAMMMALGCIQALRCNSNDCPTGVATQDKALMKGLDVKTKTKRVENYHGQTIKALIEMLGATGFDSPGQLQRVHINRRVGMTEVMNYERFFPSIKEGAFLTGNIPNQYAHLLQEEGISGY